MAAAEQRAAAGVELSDLQAGAPNVDESAAGGRLPLEVAIDRVAARRAGAAARDGALGTEGAVADADREARRGLFRVDGIAGNPSAQGFALKSRAWGTGRGERRCCRLPGLAVCDADGRPMQAH